MPVLSPIHVSLKPTTLADCGAIAELAARIWRVHYPLIIGSEQVEYMLTTMHTPEKVEEQMKKGQSFSFVMQGQSVIGYVGTSEPAKGELFIHKFYIDPSHQGMGIGKKVFSEILNLHPESTTVRLTVNRMNYKSINFYFRVGFIIEEVKDFDIGNGYFMNDFIMKYVRK